MKFDFVIGNPPYQEELDNTSDRPIYNDFIDAAYAIGRIVELITPARFLFNAGKTPKEWNEKMLNDKHFKVLLCEMDSKKVFSNTEIKGGVAIHYHDISKDFGKIGIYTIYDELNKILHKVQLNNQKSLSSIIYSAENYKFSDKIYKENPEILKMTTFDAKGRKVPLISKGHEYDLVSNIFDKLVNIAFFEKKPNNNEYMQIYGRFKNDRYYMYIQKDYIENDNNINCFKVFVPKANGSGIFGEVLSTPVVGKPNEGYTQTFISIGNFQSRYEAESTLKYIKSKFCRCMLSILKVTQINQRPTWKYVPLQDFTSKSDIDWSKSIKEIDKQLYKKYKLSKEEIEFIESKVKEME